MDMYAWKHPNLSNKWPSRWVMLGTATLLGLSAVVAWRVWEPQAARVEDGIAEVAAPEISTVTALGRLEPAGEMVNLTAPTSTQAGRIEELLVEEGDRVEAGEIIATLDNRDRLQAALQQAEERVRVARAQLAQVQAGAKTGELEAQRAEIARLQADRAGNLAAQRSEIARLEAEVENARVEYGRYESLYRQGGVSASERDAKYLTYTTAREQLQRAREELARIETTTQQQIQQARATLDRIAEVRPVDIEAAKAEVQSAIAAVAEAETNLEQAMVRSFRAGQIVEIHVRPGEKIGDEGVATLGEIQQMMAIAEVYQNDIQKIAVGQPATITSPAINDTLEGTIERIGLQVQQQQVINEDPAANIDAKVVEVGVRLDEASSQKVAKLTNLQVIVTVETE